MTADPMAAVRNYVDAFNQGDAAAMAATFAASGSILDGMAPHVWQGRTATQDWYRDVLVEGKRHGASDYFITLGEPLHNNVTGNSAYVVVPATMTFKVRGRQCAAVMTTESPPKPMRARRSAFSTTNPRPSPTRMTDAVNGGAPLGRGAFCFRLVFCVMRGDIE
jgi:SnoaL-like protein